RNLLSGSCPRSQKVKRQQEPLEILPILLCCAELGAVSASRPHGTVMQACALHSPSLRPVSLILFCPGRGASTTLPLNAPVTLPPAHLPGW
ncbi:MAG: hypothetical protein U0M50_05930, partial [Paramuribaculum sp.]